MRSPEGRRSFLRGVLDPAAGTVIPLTGQGSHQLGALARANALIVVPEDVVRMEEDEPARRNVAAMTQPRPGSPTSTSPGTPGWSTSRPRT